MLGTFPFPSPPFLWNIFSRLNYRVNMKDYGQNFEYGKLYVLKKLGTEKETKTCWRLSSGFSFLSLLFAAKSLPLHCVVESVPSLQASFQLDARSPWRRRPNIETDSYVIVPAATPFCDIVTIALQRLGYSSDISNTAKGECLDWRCICQQR